MDQTYRATLGHDARSGVFTREGERQHGVKLAHEDFESEQDLQHELRQAGRAVFERLAKGEHVEPGVHKVRIEESHQATSVTRWLTLNGLALE